MDQENGTFMFNLFVEIEGWLDWRVTLTLPWTEIELTSITPGNAFEMDFNPQEDELIRRVMHREAGEESWNQTDEEPF